MFFSNTHAPNWVPPHCPNPKCIHHNTSDQSWPYKKIGYYRRRLAPHRIQRYICKACQRSFSSQTFSDSYWQKRPDLDRLIILKAVGCLTHRQIARDLKVAPETINRHIARLSERKG